MFRWRTGFLLILLAWQGSRLALLAAGSEFAFNRDIRPILADRCWACHGFDPEARQAGLRLDEAEGSVQKLDSGGRAIVPGDLRQSLLWQRINDPDPTRRMPPPETGHDLTAAEREKLRQWILAGAAYEPHWAFQAPQPPPWPANPNGVSAEHRASTSAHEAQPAHPIDRFVQARLRDVGLTPSPAAERHILLRRVTLDLTGLPPTPQEITTFSADDQPGAYERLVDRLLASPHFGERWARWWLDLAHYGDSDGYLQDFLRPVAWRYRQWVVDQLNNDLPFDQFTIAQLAGDLLPNATLEQRLGTGFLRNTLSNREGGADLEEYRVHQVLDRTVTLGTTWLGLTIECARCHDHKFDPVSQVEFYQLYAFFNAADEVNFNAPLPGQKEAWEVAKREYDRKRAALLAPIAEPLAALQADWERRLLYAESHPNEDFAWDRTLELLGLQWGQNLGEGQLEGLQIVKTPRKLRTSDQQDRLLDYFLKSPPAAYSEQFKALNLPAIQKELEALARQLPPMARAPGMMQSPVNRTTHVQVRGDFRRPATAVTSGTPAILPPLPADRAADRPADRLALARWLVAPDHPLTSRVTVNRLWQELFGRGLVPTSENFGVRGTPPTHPELLDWLALEFQRQNWSIKQILRQIVLSATYRQASLERPEIVARDPNNQLLARQSRLRLSGEAVRDSALAVSGKWVPQIGGPSVKPPQPESVSQEGYSNKWEPTPGAGRYRRGLYTFLQRTSPFAQFVTFDLPDTSRSCTRRERTNTPLQAITLLNDPVFLDLAQGLAWRLEREVPRDDTLRLEAAYRWALGRAPQPAETERLRAYLQEQRALFAAEPESATELLANSPAGTQAEWVALASVLFNLDEFITRE